MEFGVGAEQRAPALLAELGAQRVLLVATEKHRSGADALAAALGHRSVGVWDQAQPQVPKSTADALIARVDETGADWLLAHGGGTTIGVAKAAALERDLHIGAIPTTYSGSEMTPIWGLTVEGVKTTGRDPRVRPELVLYDPSLLASLRPSIRRNSLYNALAHSVDALFDDRAGDAVHDDAERSVGAILAGLQGLDEDPADLDAVAEALYGAHLAGRVLGDAQMAMHHKLAHVLGGSFGTPHAATHAVLLPYTLAYNLVAAPGAMARLRRAMGQDDPAAALHDLSKKLGIPTTLGPLGFCRADIDRAVELALRREYPNPAEVTPEGLRGVLSAAVHDRRPSQSIRRAPLEGVVGVHAGLDSSHRGPAVEQASAVVIAVHGRGSSADAFVERIAGELGPGAHIGAPQADAGSWYPKGFQQVEANAEHLRSALSALDAVFDGATAHVAPDRVVVVGFSQGACLALTWLASRVGRSRPGGLAAWTGAAIPGFADFGELSGTRVYVGTAAEDPWVSLESVRGTVAGLRSAGAEVELWVAQGAEHMIRPPDLAALSRLVESSI